ncbi:MAG TPA: DUF5615 family PIN-like protein [Thermoanaerobaculia bacterium]|nr:DUF5615 family PIN-like protein [Thermoanaerobaculia bacterium]
MDEDTSRKVIHQGLIDRGHDVTKTPADWIHLGVTDEEQLLAATAQGRCIFTYNIGDFTRLSRIHPGHRGILFAHQSKWSLSGLIQALDRFLSEAEAEEVEGRLLWLNAWR